MYHPTTRVLTVLEMLQSQPEITGAEIARRLEVDGRTVRRYITMLQDMGIPVEAERGRIGGYRLYAGFKLPPLMFTNEEALALILSLRAAQQTTLTGAPIAVEGALAKVERVLPQILRQQVRDILDILDIQLTAASGIPASPNIVATLSGAVRTGTSVRLRHRAFDGEETERVLDPYGVVYRVGRWYAVGYCHLRKDIRTFRLDRMLDAELLGETFTPPNDFDTREHIERALAATPGIYRVEVLFRATLAEIQPHIPSAMGEFISVDEGVRFVCFVQHLEWVTGFLAGVPFPMKIIAPDELRVEMHRLIERATESL
jgi:predicted DNA-binding transcriptional regulator YafY